ncbi:unnamed protein product [Blepharisma stoltei]|uniref:Uncharacterized protein n=1 Tax=Blepharisma stoltei TaxID=1481888 RepID=A0AAU9IMN6_9CILI|nr:unnamed protein product [Blepharisma stoltei]
MDKIPKNHRIPRLCWVIFQVLQLSAIGLMIWALFTSSWVELNIPGFYGDLKWSGSLTSVRKGLRALEGSTYSELSSAYCSITQKSKDIPKKEPSWCEMFALLWVGEIVYYILEGVAIIAILIWIYTIGFRLKIHTSYWKTPGLCWAYLSCISHEIAFITWMILSNATFSGECDQESEGKSPPELCALKGPTIALILAVVLPIFSISYMLLTRFLPKIVEEKGIIKEDSEGKLNEADV